MDKSIQIAIGILIGGLALLFTYEGIQRYRIRSALEEMNAEMRRATAQAQAQMQAERLAARQRESAQTEAKLADAAAKRAYAASVQHAIEAEKMKRAADSEAKEAAWKKFYKPTDSCIKDSAQMDCANAHIIAKRNFETQWAANRQ